MTPEELELWHWVQAMNRLWTEADGSGLEHCFHPRMLAITPDPAFNLDGPSCVAGWQAFARSARIAFFHTSGEQVRIHGSSAVVAYRYHMEAELDGKPVTFRGREMFALHHDGSGWQVIADHFSPEPAPAPEPPL